MNETVLLQKREQFTKKSIWKWISKHQKMTLVHQV